MSKEREVVMYTGKEGAIQGAIAIEKVFCEYLNIPLTDEKIQEITEKVRSQEWKDGFYKMDKNGIEYKGNE